MRASQHGVLQLTVASVVAAVLALLTALFSVALVGAAPASASAPGQGTGAQKVPLTLHARFCQTGEPNPAFTGIGAGTGFAVINETPASRVGLDGQPLTAEVQLRGAAPHATYWVTLVQIPSGVNCTVPTLVQLTTNAQGNGSAHLADVAVVGTEGAFVFCQNTADNRDFYSTEVAHFTALPRVPTSVQPTRTARSGPATARWASVCVRRGCVALALGAAHAGQAAALQAAVSLVSPLGRRSLSLVLAWLLEHV